MLQCLLSADSSGAPVFFRIRSHRVPVWVAHIPLPTPRQSLLVSLIGTMNTSYPPCIETIDVNKWPTTVLGEGGSHCSWEPQRKECPLVTCGGPGLVIQTICLRSLVLPRAVAQEGKLLLGSQSNQHREGRVGDSCGRSGLESP